MKWPKPHTLQSWFLQGLGLYALVFEFSWSWLGFALVLFFPICWLGVDLTFHRVLSHRSLKLPLWLERFFSTLGFFAFQGGPIEWVAVHRQHHRFADRPGDPHNAAEGLYQAHMGWIDNYLEVIREDRLRSYAPRLWKDPYYQFLRQFPGVFFWGHVALLYAYGGHPAIHWGLGVRYLFTSHVTWAVNSFSHRLGWRAYDTRDLSTNTLWLALLSTGGSFHNNHHAYPRSARHGFTWWQFDLSWLTILALEKLGLATKVQRPRPEVVEQGARPQGILEFFGLWTPRDRGTTIRNEAAP